MQSGPGYANHRTHPPLLAPLRLSAHAETGVPGYIFSAIRFAMWSTCRLIRL